MRKTPPFRLVPDKISEDVVECLEQLLAHAKAGNVYGIVFGAMMKGRRVIANSAGECSRNPRFARGITQDIDDHLRDRLRS